jgi:molybdopterin-guanine dinucleotide biosynthesis protein A
MSEPYRGVPLLHHSVLRVAEVCSQVVVVISPGGPRPHLPSAPALRVARDATEWRGPLAGLSTGLVETRTDLAMVVGGDMPDLSPAVLRAMLASLAGGQPGSLVEAVALRDSGSVRPLPLAVRTVPGRPATAVLLEEGELSLLSLLSALRTVVLEEERWLPLDPEKATLRDVDVPDDLQD